MVSSTRLAWASRSRRRISRSRCKCLAMLSLTRSTEAPGNVVLGLLHLRAGVQHVRRARLDQPALEEERCQVGNARCLLHVVRHDDDGIVALQLEDQVL